MSSIPEEYRRRVAAKLALCGRCAGENTKASVVSLINGDRELHEEEPATESELRAVSHLGSHVAVLMRRC